MLNQINRLPVSLKVVVWLNLILAGFTLIQAIAALQTAGSNELIAAFLNSAVSVLVAIGILQKSRIIRIIVLVLSWLSVILLGLSFIAALVTAGIKAVIISIPILITAITIWGLSTKEARLYFGKAKNEN
jgi:hypothetical protein